MQLPQHQRNPKHREALFVQRVALLVPPQVRPEEVHPAAAVMLQSLLDMVQVMLHRMVEMGLGVAMAV